MNKLAQIQNDISGLETITPKKMQKISERMGEMERASNSLGRQPTNS